MDARKKIYIAAPLFSEAELAFNVRLAETLDAFAKVYLPQRDGILLVEAVKSGFRADDVKAKLFESDLDAIKASDVLLIVLDGRSIDEGAAFELGYAFAIGKLCVGLHTDPRRLMPIGNNPMIDMAVSKMFSSIQNVEEWLTGGGSVS